MLPKQLRESLGLAAGSKVDISPYGSGLALVPESRTARLVTDEHGHLVADSHTEVTDKEIFALIDAGRR
jgi:AbrB family looped-hinge helix DNA binding protein